MLSRKILLLTLFCIYNSSTYAGIVIGGTRFIFNEGDRDSSMTIKNTTEKNVYLVQSWIDADENKTPPPLIATPPLFRIDPKKENILRIIQTGDGMPLDRESLYWINIKNIPSVDTDNAKNSLQLVIKSRLKVFFRPKGLTTKAAEAYKSLKFSLVNGSLQVNNPTPYYISLYSVKFNDIEYNDVDMVPPKDSVLFDKVKVQSPLKIDWQAINDSGGITDSESVKL